jgi:glutaredoxin
MPKKQTNIGEAMKVILYSNHCPKCEMMKKMLDMKNISYDIFDNEDEMIKMGFSSMPMISIDGKIMDFSDGISWVKNN